MALHFADRLVAATTEKNTVACVGLDVVYEKLPEAIRNDPNFNDDADTQVAMDAALEFCTRVLKVVAPHVAAVKINSAFFERYFRDGVDAYYSLIQEAQGQKLLVIGDVKRGDVDFSAVGYAEGLLADPDFENLDGEGNADAITVNPYFGIDGIKPFLDVVREHGKGIFVLCRTSNESAREIQDFKDASGRPLWQHVADRINTWGAAPDLQGRSGFSSVGAVAGATYADDLKKVRELLPRSLILVPGYGAQGASARDCAAAFIAGKGAIVSATRSVLYAYNEPQYSTRFPSWEKCIEQAVIDMKDDLNKALGRQ